MSARLGLFLAGVAFVALAIPTPVARATADDSAIAVAAIAAGDQADWQSARAYAATASDPVVGKLVVWLDASRPQGGGGSFAEISGFVRDNPDWPQLKTLRVAAEQAIDPSTSDAAILAWFGGNAPLTLPGAQRFAQALIANGEDARAVEAVRAGWVNADAQTVDDEESFYLAFGDVLTSDVSALRLDRLLWAGRTTPAQRLLSRVDDGTRALGEARIALRLLRDDAQSLAAMVPPELQSDPGLIYEQVRWYRRKGSDSSARQLLIRHPVDAASPEPFWQERSQLARQALSDGSFEDAYRSAANHGFTGDSQYGDSEWLAGWIALRFLDQPEVASRHFLAMFENVTHPVSRARGAYWSGRAQAAMGQTEAAALWYKAAAQHPVAFYGQLASAEIRPDQPLRLPADPPRDPAEAPRFRNHELVRALRLLAVAGERDPQRAFILRLAEIGNSGGWNDMTASLAYEIDRPDLAVAVARQSIRSSMPLPTNGYPTLALSDGGGGYRVETPLIFAIIRQESAFDTRAVSPAGAQGLMQLMPATARGVAGKLGMDYAPSSLTDADYNIALGQAYIGSMLDRFGGSNALALAAYNAGPGRVDQWLRSNGDPRASIEATIDWIEMIPFTETRNYVQRCLENLQVYRTRLGGMQVARADGPM